jgi:catechol 2,3-dioxygenase-like lactoylglutathione lyase family enzyme
LLLVEDLDRSIAFYRDQLGFSLGGTAEADGKIFWCRLQRGGASLMLEQAEEALPPGERGRGVHFYFVCEDAEAMYRELSERGLEIGPPSVAYYGMKQIFVPEPDGYSICFESPVPDTRAEMP